MLQARHLHLSSVTSTEQGGLLYHVRLYSRRVPFDHKARLTRLKTLTGRPLYQLMHEAESLYLDQLDQAGGQLRLSAVVEPSPQALATSARAELAQLEQQHLPPDRPAPHDRDQRYLWEAEQEARRGYRRLRERERGRSWAPVAERLDILREHLEGIPARLEARRAHLARCQQLRREEEQRERQQLDQDVADYRAQAQLRRSRRSSPQRE